MLRSPHPPSILGTYSLPVSICGWYILFIIVIFCVFLSITFSSYFVNFIQHYILLRIQLCSLLPLLYFHHSISLMSAVSLSYYVPYGFYPSFHYISLHYIISFQNNLALHGVNPKSQLKKTLSICNLCLTLILVLLLQMKVLLHQH